MSSDALLVSSSATYNIFPQNPQSGSTRYSAFMSSAYCNEYIADEINDMR